MELVKLLLGGEKLGNMFHICQVTVFYVMVSKHLKGRLDPPVSDEKCM